MPTGGMEWPPGDPAAEQAAAFCRYCRGEIYRGDAYYQVGDAAVCEDCLDALAREYFRLNKVEGGA